MVLNVKIDFFIWKRKTTPGLIKLAWIANSTGLKQPWLWPQSGLFIGPSRLKVSRLCWQSCQPAVLGKWVRHAAAEEEVDRAVRRCRPLNESNHPTNQPTNERTNRWKGKTRTQSQLTKLRVESKPNLDSENKDVIRAGRRPPPPWSQFKYTCQRGSPSPWTGPAGPPVPRPASSLSLVSPFGACPSLEQGPSPSCRSLLR